MRPARRYVSLLPWLALVPLLVLAWFAYRPGLGGGFLFDDFVNLPALGKAGAIDNMAALWRYLTSGTADPTGRPLALLSFLLDARNWPADPAPFLRTNILLHLLNATLLFALLRTLGRTLDGTRNVIPSKAKDLLSEDVTGQAKNRSFNAFWTTNARADAAALLGAGLWVLHPLFVSTTLYIVQREAMLPVTFVLLGLLAWLHGRRLLPDAPRAGMAWMVLGIGLGTVLAMLCKANGVLLPVLAWVLDATVLRPSMSDTSMSNPAPDARTRRRLHWLRILLLVLPSLVLFAYLLGRLPHLGETVDMRPWTIGQRLLTEPRVLLDYLHLLVIPRVLSSGLYNDAYIYSTGLLQPAATLPALLAVLCLVALAFVLRRRAPALSAALLFYFAGHLLESSVIPLELYFEHRNYLPALLLGWPLARALFKWHGPVWTRGVVAASLLAILAATTWQRATLWTDQGEMALLWAVQSPASSRAQATAASFELRAHHPDRAMGRLAEPWRQRPQDLQLALNYIDATCAMRGLRPSEIAAAAVSMRTATIGGQMLYRWLGGVLDTAKAGLCPGLDLTTIARWIAAARANPHMADVPGRQQDLFSLAGRLALAQGDDATALIEFNRALDTSPTPQAAASQASLLASSGAFREGLAHLDHFAAIESRAEMDAGWNMPRLHAWVLRRQSFWQNELSTLRRNMQADLAAKELAAKHHDGN